MSRAGGVVPSSALVAAHGRLILTVQRTRFDAITAKMRLHDPALATAIFDDVERLDDNGEASSVCDR